MLAHIWSKESYVPLTMKILVGVSKSSFIDLNQPVPRLTTLKNKTKKKNKNKKQQKTNSENFSGCFKKYIHW